MRPHRVLILRAWMYAVHEFFVRGCMPAHGLVIHLPPSRSRMPSSSLRRRVMCADCLTCVWCGVYQLPRLHQVRAPGLPPAVARGLQEPPGTHTHTRTQPTHEPSCLGPAPSPPLMLSCTYECVCGNDSPHPTPPSCARQPPRHTPTPLCVRGDAPTPHPPRHTHPQRRCELCGEAFAFAPVYRQGAPQQLTPWQVLGGWVDDVHTYVRAYACTRACVWCIGVRVCTTDAMAGPGGVGG
jgi:hypothetical protein